MTGPTLPFSDALHAQKYRGPNESFREAMNRVASALTSTDDEYRRFREVLLDMRFMPAGRIQSAVGATKRVTPYNCFVSGRIEDSFVEGHGSIMDRAKEAATTMRMGGGIGYDFSTLRPRGDAIKKLGSRSSGPVSFMKIYNAICLCVASSGHRRGAQMGVMRIDHPDVEEFVRAKHNEHDLTGFNISLAVTDEFMHCLNTPQRLFPLRWGGQVYREVDPVALWEMIMRSTWDWAEPGVLFIDTINRANNLAYCEEICATNPCGEQPLPPFGACLLGSFNLARYVHGAPGSWQFDWRAFSSDIGVVVAAMDRVVDVASYPLYEQEQEALRKRRMGLGVTGLANAAEALGHEYGSDAFVEFEAGVLRRLRDDAYEASALLAARRGAFPLFRRDEYLASPFLETLPPRVRDLVAEHGIRNSHLLSIAPTGTISLCADNVSSGIEPVFDYEFERTVQEFEGPRTYRVEDYGRRVFGVEGKRSEDVTPAEHLAVLATAYRFVDSAVSKTCNVPSDTPWEEFRGLYQAAWARGCKGITTFQVGGRRSGVLRQVEESREPAAQAEEAGAACRMDPATGRRECE